MKIGPRIITRPRRDSDRYAANFPAELWRTFRPEIESLSWLIAPWVTRLYIQYAESEGHNIAEVEVHEQYRFADLTITAKYFQLDAERRRRTLIHELLHIALNPLSRVARDMMNDKRLDANARGFIDRWLTDREEAVVEDLACVIGDRLVSRADARALDRAMKRVRGRVKKGRRRR